MQELVTDYSLTIISLAALAGLMIVQALVADAVAIKLKHPPGVPVDADHASFLFRAVRAQGNMNENIGLLLLLVLLGLLSGADPLWFNRLTCAYVVTRFVYAGCYYTDARTLRSTVFALSLVIMIAMLVMAVLPWCM